MTPSSPSTSVFTDDSGMRRRTAVRAVWLLVGAVVVAAGAVGVSIGGHVALPGLDSPLRVPNAGSAEPRTEATAESAAGSRNGVNGPSVARPDSAAPSTSGAGGASSDRMAQTPLAAPSVAPSAAPSVVPSASASPGAAPVEPDRAPTATAAGRPTARPTTAAQPTHSPGSPPTEPPGKLKPTTGAS